MGRKRTRDFRTRALEDWNWERSRWAKASLAHLREHLGRLRALDITTARVRQYMEDRRAEGAAAGTVNRELAVLGRMFALAIQGNVLTARPYLPKLKEAEPRQGFFEYSEYLAVKQNLPVEYQEVVEFGYFSGWRRGEIVSLEWRDIDRTGRVIRLRVHNRRIRKAGRWRLKDPSRL